MIARVHALAEADVQIDAATRTALDDLEDALSSARHACTEELHRLETAPDAGPWSFAPTMISLVENLHALADTLAVLEETYAPPSLP